MVESLMRGLVVAAVGLLMVAFIAVGVVLAVNLLVVTVTDPGRTLPWLIFFVVAALILEAGARLRVRLGRLWEISGRRS